MSFEEKGAPSRLRAGLEMLLPHEHPSGCGRLGKRYSKYDLVSPIVDVMVLLHTRSHLGVGKSDAVKKRARKGKLVAARPPKTAARTNTLLCMGCNTANPLDFTIDEHNFKVCKCGVVTGLASYGADYKEVNATEKSEARTDVRPEKDAIDHASFRKSTTVVPEKARKKMGHAPNIAAKATPEDSQLDRKYQRKLTAVMEELAKLTTAMKPVDSAIARAIRINADKVFRDSVTHFACCNKLSCELALFNKTARVIATKSFVYTLEKLCNGDGIHGVTRQTLMSLHQRVQSSQAFNLRQNPTQHESCLAMIASLDTQCITLPCKDVENSDHSFAQVCKGGEPVALSRQASNVQSCIIMQIRDAICRIGQECSFKHSVRDQTMAALLDPIFASAVKSNALIPASASKYATAYVLLRSVAETSAPGCFFLEKEHAARVGLSESELEKMLVRVKRALPRPQARAQAFCEDDDFLY